MKTFSTLFIAMIALVAIGCSSKTTQATIDTDTTDALSIDSLLTNAPTYVDSLITIEGVCTHTCRHGATKMFLVGSDNTKVLRVEADKLGSFSPDVINSLVTVKGYLREQRVDEKYIDNWENMLLAEVAEQLEDNSTGCDTERASRGVKSDNANDMIAEYRQRLADNIAAGGNPWLSFYHFQAADYTVNP